MSNSSHTITLANGNLYLSSEVFNTYFPGIQSVVLLHDAPQILIVPVRQEGAGGLLVKIKNVQGDRVVHGAEFFQSIGFEVPEAVILPAQWDSERAALVFGQ